MTETIPHVTANSTAEVADTPMVMTNAPPAPTMRTAETTALNIIFPGGS